MDGMTQTDLGDLGHKSREEQLNIVRNASLDERNRIMCNYDWKQYPEAVLGWASAQRGISLSTALSAFFNGDPWRFNYLPKRDVGAEFRCTISLLDAICQRINAGFYLPEATKPCEDGMHRLNNWVENQKRDHRSHRRGRWVIEADILEPLLTCQRQAVENELRSEPAFLIKKPEPQDRSGFSLKKLAVSLAG